MFGLRKLLGVALVLFAVFFGFEFFKVHTSSDVIAHKRFAEALMQNDSYTARMTSIPEVAHAAFATNPERQQRYRDLRIRFTYFDVKSQFLSNEGNRSELIVEQITRVSRPGHRFFWGNGEIRTGQKSVLERRNGIWRVVAFDDPAMEK